MPAIRHSEIVIPRQLSDDERQRLIDDLYPIHCQIFDGVEKASFAKYVVLSKAEYTAIQLHKNAEEQVVGYFAFHVFTKKLRGALVAVIRAEAGTLREYRGRNSNARFGLEQVMRYRLAHPMRPIYYLGTLVHPSSYALFAKYCHEIWPGREWALAPDIAAFMANLAEAFELEPVDAAQPLVVQVGWRTRDTEVERDYWRTCDKPAAQYFGQMNPNYGEGHGLMTMVPLNSRNLTHALGRIVAERWQRQAQALRSAAQRLPLIGQRLGAADIKRHLKRLLLFAGLSDADLAQVVPAAEMISLKAGSYVLHEGDASNELYVIAIGSAYALVNRGGEEHVIDQLATGAMFGEIAMLSGEPRTASIRTAAKTTLIRIRRAALLALMETHPSIHEAVWAGFARRRFELVATGTTRFSRLSREQRSDWFAHGRPQQHEVGETATLDSLWVFLVTGTVELDQAGSMLLVRAPALIEVKQPVSLIAHTSTRLVQLPAPNTLEAAMTGMAAGNGV